MEMKQLPVLSSVGDILMGRQLRGNQVRILNSRAAVCVQPDFVIHCMLCEKENLVLLRKSEYLLRAVAIYYTK